MNRAKFALTLAVPAGLLATSWLVSSALALTRDSPIIVRDGSIAIRHVGGNLRDWKASDRSTIEHPKQDQSMAVVEISGPGARNATCAGRGRCVVEMKWSTGHSVRIVSRAGGRGLAVTSSVAFDDAGWDKSTDEWRFTLPPGATPTITIRDQSTAGQPETICSGKACQVTIHYE